MSEKKHKLMRVSELLLDDKKLTDKMVKLAHHNIKHPNDKITEHKTDTLLKWHQWLKGDGIV